MAVEMTCKSLCSLRPNCTNCRGVANCWGRGQRFAMEVVGHSLRRFTTAHGSRAGSLTLAMLVALRFLEIVAPFFQGSRLSAMDHRARC